MTSKENEESFAETEALKDRSGALIVDAIEQVTRAHNAVGRLNGIASRMVDLVYSLEESIREEEYATMRKLNPRLEHYIKKLNEIFPDKLDQEAG